jgi:uncharacterized protein with PhoU and TrkA domain
VKIGSCALYGVSRASREHNPLAPARENPTHLNRYMPFSHADELGIEIRYSTDIDAPRTDVDVQRRTVTLADGLTVGEERAALALALTRFAPLTKKRAVLAARRVLPLELLIAAIKLAGAGHRGPDLHQLAELLVVDVLTVVVRINAALADERERVELTRVCDERTLRIKSRGDSCVHVIGEMAVPVHRRSDALVS